MVQSFYAAPFFVGCKRVGDNGDNYFQNVSPIDIVQS